MKGPDYDYLLGMAMWSLTKERKDELLKKRDEKTQELEELKKKSPENLWLTDLDEFLKKVKCLKICNACIMEVLCTRDNDISFLNPQ